MFTGTTSKFTCFSQRVASTPAYGIGVAHLMDLRGVMSSLFGFRCVYFFINSTWLGSHTQVIMRISASSARDLWVGASWSRCEKHILLLPGECGHDHSLPPSDALALALPSSLQDPINFCRPPVRWTASKESMDFGPFLNIEFQKYFFYYCYIYNIVEFLSVKITKNHVKFTKNVCPFTM